MDLVEILQLIGDSEFNLAKHKDSADSYQCCVTLVAKDKTAFAPAEKMKINKKIGISLKKINDYKKAIQYFLKALGIEGDTPKCEKA